MASAYKSVCHADKKGVSGGIALSREAKNEAA